MSENTLAVKLTADIVDLQTKFVQAQATAKDFEKAMKDLAKQSAQGVLDPNGLAQLQEASRAFLEAKAAAAELKEQLQGTRESSVSLGESLSEIRGRISNAFEITGIAAAYEGIKQVAEAVEQAGERMLQMRTSADVLGITTDEFQAMGAAAEESGVPIEMLTRSAERLNAMLTAARDGSGAAVEKLLALGVSAKQIHDPTFDIASLMLVLHERLTNTATATETMNELVRELGARAGLTAEAIKKLDFSAAGIAATMAKLHGLTQQNIDDGSELAIKVAEQKTIIANQWDRIILKAAEYSQWLQKNIAFEKAAGEFVGAEAPKEAKPNVGTIDRSAQDAAKEAAQAQMDLQREVAAQELENVKAGVEAYKQGSAEKLAALTEYARLASQYYGADVDIVKRASTAVIAEQRVRNETIAADREKAIRETMRADDLEAKARLAGIKSAIDVEGEYLGQLQKEETQYKELLTFTTEFNNSVLQARKKLTQDINTLATKEMQEQLAHWKFLASAIQTSLGSAFSGLLAGTESFGQAARNVFKSIADSALQNSAKNIATMVQESLVGKGLRSQQIREDAGAGAAAAYKAVVGIPVVGPILAPIAAGVAYAGILAFDSAEGGYDIPAGLSPLVQTHPREMILPAPLAEGFRNIIGQQGGQGGGGATHLNVSFTVQALDSRDAARYFHENGSSIADALATQMQRFHPALTR